MELTATSLENANTISQSSLHSLWMSFLVILVSEIGDKTFLISAVMAMTNPR